MCDGIGFAATALYGLWASGISTSNAAATPHPCPTSHSPWRTWPPHPLARELAGLARHEGGSVLRVRPSRGDAVRRGGRPALRAGRRARARAGVRPEPLRPRLESGDVAAGRSRCRWCWEPGSWAPSSRWAGAVTSSRTGDRRRRRSCSTAAVAAPSPPRWRPDLCGWLEIFGTTRWGGYGSSSPSRPRRRAARARTTTRWPSRPANAGQHGVAHGEPPRQPAARRPGAGPVGRRRRRRRARCSVRSSSAPPSSEPSVHPTRPSTCGRSAPTWSSATRVPDLGRALLEATGGRRFGRGARHRWRGQLGRESCVTRGRLSRHLRCSRW